MAKAKSTSPKKPAPTTAPATKPAPATSNSMLYVVLSIAIIVIAGLIIVVILLANKPSPDVKGRVKKAVEAAKAEATAEAEKKATDEKLAAEKAKLAESVEGLKKQLEEATRPVVPPPSKEDREMKVVELAAETPHGEADVYLKNLDIHWMSGPMASKNQERLIEIARQEGEANLVRANADYAARLAELGFDQEMAKIKDSREAEKAERGETMKAAEKAVEEARKALEERISALETKIEAGEKLLGAKSASSQSTTARNTDRALVRAVNAMKAEVARLRAELSDRTVRLYWNGCNWVEMKE